MSNIGMKRLVIGFMMMLMFKNLAAEPKHVIGEFSSNQLNGWESKSSDGETEYHLELMGDLTVLKAHSHASASGMFKEQRIDLEQTPFLNWSWRIANRLDGLIEQTKAGDDYAARMYVIVKGGLAFWQTKAINYVWSSNTLKETVWPNAYAGDQLMMLALRGPEASLNVWHSEKRNVRADLKQLFSEDIRYIDAVALMTDTDNSNSQASAYYGDIWFSKN
jgi:hypothetical protein